MIRVYDLQQVAGLVTFEGDGPLARTGLIVFGVVARDFIRRFFQVSCSFFSGIPLAGIISAVFLL